MQIIIPMSGFGERFKRAGYKIPKPLIEVEGKPIISHVIDMFPGEKNFIFICNKEHLESTNMEKILKRYSKEGQIVAINPHKKGPVFAVNQALDYINDEESVIINYCDFSCYWDYKKYKSWIKDKKIDGSIPAYKGFHPHSLGKTNYAYMRENNGKMIEIKEKEPFTNDRINEYASSGTYHFAKGAYIKDYFPKLIKENININGEYYCSLVYNLMVKDNLDIGIYEIEHFMQWGTPEDLEEYISWSNIFKDLVKTKTKHKCAGTTIIPMAGYGSRFAKASYKVPKPFIEVSGLPMFVQSTRSLPRSEKYVFISIENFVKEIKSNKFLSNNNINNDIISLTSTPQGQALTALEGIDFCIPDQPLTISACDHAVIYNKSEFDKLINISNFDLIIWTKKIHLPAIHNPEMYGWLKTKEGNVIDVSVKKAFKDSDLEYVIIGTFTFKNTKIFSNLVSSLISRKGLVNNEYYIDSLIKDALELKYTCKLFEVDQFICWGTPNELRTFKYWQNCFRKWDSHPYKIENDIFYSNFHI